MAKLKFKNGLGRLVPDQPAERSKIEPDIQRQAKTHPDHEGAPSIARTAVVIEVNEAGYVPAGVHVRMRMSAEIFTADVPVALLDRLSRDPHVRSVSTPKVIAAPPTRE